MNDLTRTLKKSMTHTEMRQQQFHVKRKLTRIKATCAALSLRADWCRELRRSAKKRSAVSIHEIASGPNVLLLVSLSLFGTAVCWIIGDMMHWLLGILFAIVGLCVSVIVVLRVTFNATLFSDEQLERIQDASTARLALLNADVVKLESQLTRLLPLVEAGECFSPSEVEYMRDRSDLFLRWAMTKGGLGEKELTKVDYIISGLKTIRFSRGSKCLYAFRFEIELNELFPIHDWCSSDETLKTFGSCRKRNYLSYRIEDWKREHLAEE